MSFLYPFLNLYQPGVLYPELAFLRPTVTMGLLGILVGLRRRPIYDRAAAFKHRLFIATCWFLLAQVLSVKYSGFSSMLDEFSFWFVYLLYMIVTILLVADLDALRRYVWGMILGGIWIVGVGIYAVIYKVGFGVTGRAGAYGMYENHNDYTFVIMQILPFIYFYWRTAEGFWKRAFLLASMATCTVGVLMSLSRGGMLALLLQALLIITWGMTSPRRWWLLPILGVIGAGGIGYQWATRAAQATTYTAEDAESSRFELWRAAQKMFLANPVFGVGSRRFGEHAGEYEELSYDQRGKNSHNTYLEILATSGLLGFLPFVAMCWWLVRELRQEPPPDTPPLVVAMGKATLIAFVTILFRSLFDAKSWDWSFYTLVPLAIVCVLMRSSSREAAEDPFAFLNAPSAS